MQVSRTGKYYEKKMPCKDAQLKSVIEGVIGCSRKGREKVIRLVQRKHPHISSSKIRRVYEKEGFSLYKRLKRRVKHQPDNPITIPVVANEESFFKRVYGSTVLKELLIVLAEIVALNLTKISTNLSVYIMG